MKNVDYLTQLVEIQSGLSNFLNECGHMDYSRARVDIFLDAITKVINDLEENVSVADS